VFEEGVEGDLRFLVRWESNGEPRVVGRVVDASRIVRADNGGNGAVLL
jgi:hypothetical protein